MTLDSGIEGWDHTFIIVPLLQNNFNQCSVNEKVV